MTVAARLIVNFFMISVVDNHTICSTTLKVKFSVVDGLLQLIGRGKNKDKECLDIVLH